MRSRDGIGVCSFFLRSVFCLFCIFNSILVIFHSHCACAGASSQPIPHFSSTNGPVLSERTDLQLPVQQVNNDRDDWSNFSANACRQITTTTILVCYAGKPMWQGLHFHAETWLALTFYDVVTLVFLNFFYLNFSQKFLLNKLIMWTSITEVLFLFCHSSLARIIHSPSTLIRNTCAPAHLCSQPIMWQLHDA